MTFLPPRIPKKAKRTSRFRSPAHTKWVGEHACANCGYMPGPGGRNQAAHVRMESGAGMGEKPDDWRTVPLCGPCHNGDQHTKMGEPAFWEAYRKRNGHTVWQLIDELCAKSPKAREIKIHREDGDKLNKRPSAY